MKSEQIKEITEKATEQLVAVLRAYFVPLFGNAIAEDIKPLDSQRWLKSLHESNGLAWTTISKMRSIMYRIYKIRILYEHVTKNPVQHVETRSKSDYKAIVITPAQTLATLKALPSLLHFTLLLTCAATGAPSFADPGATCARHFRGYRTAVRTNQALRRISQRHR
jgi:hypothetical protein